MDVVDLYQAEVRTVPILNQAAEHPDRYWRFWDWITDATPNAGYRLLELSVDPGRRHEGIGSALVKHCLAIAHRDGDKFVLAQDAVVDEHASEPRVAPLPSRMARSTRVAATAESTPPERAQMARPSPTVWRTLAMVASMKCCAVQVGLAPQMFEGEVAQDVRARLGVVDFGMELHRPHLSLGSFDGGHRTGRTGHQVEAGGQFYRFVAVRHPDGKFCGEAFEKAASRS